MRAPSWSVWWVWDQRSISGQVCPTQKTEALSGGPLEEKSHSLISTWACQVQPIFPLIVYLCFQAILTLSDVIYVLYNIFKLILFFSFLLVCLIKDRKQGCVAMTTGFFAGLWDVVSCSNKEKYICKKPAEGVAVTTVPPTTAALSCEAGWNPVVNRNMCYKVRGQTELSCEIVAVFKYTQLVLIIHLFFTHEKALQKIKGAQEDLARSTGLLPSHWRGSDEHTQYAGPEQRSVCWLNILYMSEFIFCYSIIKVITGFFWFYTGFIHLTQLGLASAWVPIKVLSGVMGRLYVALYCCHKKL